jgi:hypothetical protein
LVTTSEDVLVLALCAVSNGTDDFDGNSVSTVATGTQLIGVRSNGNKTRTITIEEHLSTFLAEYGSFDIKLKSSIDATFASHIIGYTDLSPDDVGGSRGSNLAIGTNTASITVDA